MPPVYELDFIQAFCHITRIGRIYMYGLAAILVAPVIVRSTAVDVYAIDFSIY
jgi:hypothetical protein